MNSLDQAAAATLAGLFDHIPAGIIVLDHELMLAIANKAAQGLVGLKRPFVAGAGPDGFGEDWPERETLLNACRAVLETGVPQRLTTPFQPKEWVDPNLYDVTCFPISGPDGAAKQVGLLLQDVTAQRAEEASRAGRETLLDSLFEHVPADIAVFDRDHRVVLVNPSAAKGYGMDEASVVGRHCSELAEFWNDFEGSLAIGIEVLEKGEAKRFTARFTPSGTGRQIVYDSMCFPIGFKAGGVQHVGMFHFDITEQHQAQVALAEQQANLLAFFDYAPLQVYVTDLDHKIVMVNDWVYRETGAEVFLPKNVIGLSADQMVPSSWADLSHDNDATVVGKRDVTQVEVRGQFGGKERDIISLRFPIKNADGEVVRIGGFVVDVTKQKEAERALKERLAQSHQSEKLAALGQLLAGVAHELNNPLTVVVGRSAILEEKLAGTPHERAITSLREAADRCNRIVKTFLAMARQSVPRRGRVQLNDTLEAALDMTVYGIRSAGVELIYRREARLPEVHADEDQLVQVITNLLINAQHALDGHDGPRSIRIAAKPVDGRVTIKIADSGPGVPADLESRIFEPFFTTKEVGQGTGMGLAMARGMIEEHGGTLTYSPAPGGGACFEVSLPVAVGSHDDSEVDAASEQPINSRGRVLIVDDEASIREMLGEILDANGLEFVEAADGTEALMCLSGEQFDLIFCDVRMPGMDGISLRRELAASQPDLLARLIFMSGDVLQRDRARYAEIGDHIFVEKPFNPAEVRRIAFEILGQPGDPR